MKSTNQEIWEARVSAWRSSGQSARLFCEKHGLSASTLYQWSSKLGSDLASTTRDSSAKFVEVVVPIVQPLSESMLPDRYSLEVVLRGGRRIAIGANFDKMVLHDLIMTLEAGQ